MKSYRLVVRQQGRVVGHFETTGSEALEDVCEVGRYLAPLADISVIYRFLTARSGFWKAAQKG
jgi:hypothetical protein